MKKVGVILFVCLVLLVGFVNAGCSVGLAESCEDYEIIGFSSQTNAHVQFPYVNYKYAVCCEEDFSSTSCDSPFVYLSNADNSHISTTEISGVYNLGVCIENVDCGLCDSFSAVAGSPLLYLSSATNGHISLTQVEGYDIEICCDNVVVNGCGVSCGNRECGEVCVDTEWEDDCGDCDLGDSCTPQGLCVEDIGYVANFCEDYLEEDDCENSDEGVGIFFGLTYSEGANGCRFREDGIGCLWNLDEGECLQETEFSVYEEDIGNQECTPPSPCAYSEEITGDCSNADALTVVYTSVPLNDKCVLNPKTIPCVGTEKLGFFSFFNFVITLFCIGLIYGVLILRGGKK